MEKMTKTVLMLLGICFVIGVGYWTYDQGYWEGMTNATNTSLQIIYQNSPQVDGQVITGGAQSGGYVDANNPTTSAGTNNKPIETLKTSLKDKYTQAAVSLGNVSFYVPNADVSDPYILPLDRMEVVSGSANTTNSILQTLGNYDTYFVGYGTYYDEKLAQALVNYNAQTGVGYLMLDGKSYIPATAFGSFVSVDTLPEVGSGFIQTGAWNSSNTTTTNVSCMNLQTLATSGTSYFRMDLGNNNANSELSNVVLCIKDTGTVAFTGSEITGFTATYVSGSTKIRIPGDLQKYWKDAAGSGNAVCMPIAQNLGPSEKARWEFTLTADVTAAGWKPYNISYNGTTGDIAANNWNINQTFQILQDDNNNYLGKQYPSSNTKAAARVLNIAACVE